MNTRTVRQHPKSVNVHILSKMIGGTMATRHYLLQLSYAIHEIPRLISRLTKCRSRLTIPRRPPSLRSLEPLRYIHTKGILTCSINHLLDGRLLHGQRPGQLAPQFRWAICRALIRPSQIPRRIKSYGRLPLTFLVHQLTKDPYNLSSRPWGLVTGQFRRHL